MDGLFVTTKSVNEIKSEIADVINIGNRHFGNVAQEISLYKTFCKKTIQILYECFIPNMYGVQRCINAIQSRSVSDDIERIRAAKTLANGTIINISIQLAQIVPLKDFPSCRKLLDMVPDVATSCAKDLIKNKIVKTEVGVMLLKSKTKDAIDIADVWYFYNSILQELERERKDGWSWIPIEQALHQKARVERAYCFLAMLKTGCSISKEMKDIMDELTAKEDISQQDNMLIDNDFSGYIIGNLLPPTERV